MKKTTLVVCVVALVAAASGVMVQAQSSAHWPQWRGPFFNGSQNTLFCIAEKK
jgi:hypothetical protein